MPISPDTCLVCWYFSLFTLVTRKSTVPRAASHPELQHEPEFGGFPLSIVDARALEPTRVSPNARCFTSEIAIDSAVVLIFEHNQLARKFKLDHFPCTRGEWYKYIFWPVHANGGDHQYLDERHIHVNMSPYAKLATAMRAPSRCNRFGYQRGCIVYPRTTKITEELGESQKPSMWKLSSCMFKRCPTQAFFMHVQKMPNPLNLFRLSLTQLKAPRQEDLITGATFLLRFMQTRITTMQLAHQTGRTQRKFTTGEMHQTTPRP